MTRVEYFKQKERIEEAAKNAVCNLNKEYLRANNPYKGCNIVGDKIGNISIFHINAVIGKDKLPMCKYVGKDIETEKIRCILQNDVIYSTSI